MRQSRWPFIVGALIATIIVCVWALGEIGVAEVKGIESLAFSLFVCLFCLPLALLMWIRVFWVPLAGHIDGDLLVLWSIDLFPRRIRIPLASVYDANITEKNVMGDPIPILRLLLTDGEEIASLRSSFRSVPHFGFYKGHFDCSHWLGRQASEVLADEIRCKIQNQGALSAGK